jgi:tetratricopeptide (TPR) repeat protein
LANLYLGTGKALLAQQEYLRALWLDSRFYPAYLGLGQFYLARGQTNEAAFYFKKALEIYPDLPEIKNFLGQPKQ